MIYDTFDNVDIYAASCPGLDKAVAFAKGFDLDSPDGKYEIDGEKIFALVQSYESKPAEKVAFEAHKNYADVQIVLAGIEKIGVAQDSDLTVKQAYKSENDCALFEAPANYSSVVMTPEKFVLLLPADAHQPCVAIAEPQAIRKIVVKIRL